MTKFCITIGSLVFESFEKQDIWMTTKGLTHWMTSNEMTYRQVEVIFITI